jgi:hypothetical protein
MRGSPLIEGWRQGCLTFQLSLLNTRDWGSDLARFPAWAHADRALLELGPGDMLFIPFYWWHAVWGIDQNMSINYWWPVRRGNRLQHPRQTARWSFREAVLSAAAHRPGAQSSP